MEERYFLLSAMIPPTDHITDRACSVSGYVGHGAPADQRESARSVPIEGRTKAEAQTTEIPRVIVR